MSIYDVKAELLYKIIEKQDELINFFGKNISDNAMFLQLHHIGASEEDCKKGFNLRKELASLRQQLEKAQEDKPLSSNNNNVGMCGDEGEYWRDEDGSLSLR